ncbi:restriction endonuclease [Methylobacterium nonmethylotrophicum]|nr:restriction endonuclease [Methylobacterium nonmethylotrophicum]
MTDPAGIKASAVIPEVAKSFELTEFEKGNYASGAQRFEKILRFSTIGPVKAGWLQKEKGVWTVTDSGQKAYIQFVDSEAFYKEACRLYDQWKQRRDAVSTDQAENLDGVVSEDSVDSLSVVLEAAQDQAWTQIEQFLKATDPFEFQDIVADLLRGMKYFVSWVSPPGRDGGVDIIAYTDPLGATGPRIKVQVKRWQNKVDVDGVRSFIATISNGDMGIFVCLAGFTKDASDYARNQERCRITLLTAEQLVALWIENYGNLSDTARQKLPLTPVYFLAPKA